MISQKCQYALRAVFELSRRRGQGPVTAAELAKAQAIPEQFLEVILGELKQGGFVRAKRGRRGGYEVVKDPARITVGDVIRFVEGPLGPVSCVAVGPTAGKCSFEGDCVFLPLWKRAYDAVAAVYDSVTIQGLIDEDARRSGRFVPHYTI